ncbi:hypothetical protein LY78DRAFT_409547 [Colletotrichum sublineola]|nr:hypothetical protein LY78DRAFT_409547 [Colletotrichum sublineola]
MPSAKPAPPASSSVSLALELCPGCHRVVLSLSVGVVSEKRAAKEREVIVRCPFNQVRTREQVHASKSLFMLSRSSGGRSPPIRPDLGGGEGRGKHDEPCLQSSGSNHHHVYCRL